MRRPLSVPVLVLALLLAPSCATSPELFISEDAYSAAFQAGVRTAKSLGYVPKKVDERTRLMTVEKVCGCSELLVRYEPQPQGRVRVSFSGTALFGAFHDDVPRIRAAIAAAR